jgi:hypothetical protein
MSKLLFYLQNGLMVSIYPAEKLRAIGAVLKVLRGIQNVANLQTAAA